MRNLVITFIALTILTTGLHAAEIFEKAPVFYSYDATNGLADNSAQIVMCTKTGRIVTTTIGHVNFYDGYSFTHIDPDERDAAALPDYDGRYQIYFDRFHHLWMKHDHMMMCVDLLTERFIPQSDKVFSEMGMTRPVSDFYGDGNSNLWFRSDRMLYCPAQKKEIALKRRAVLQDVELYRDSLLMLFHADGSLVVYDFRTGRHLRTDEALHGDDCDRYSQMSEVCLVGNKCYQLRCGYKESVLLRYDIDSRQWTVLMRKPFLMNCIYPRDGRLYIGAEKGYIVYETAVGREVSIDHLFLTKGRQLQTAVTSIAFDRQGGLWLGTESTGLLYAKAYKTPFTLYAVNSAEAQPFLELLKQIVGIEETLPRTVNTVYNDSRKWRWTGTKSGLLLQKNNGQRQVFNQKDGMTNEVVHSIIEDNNHDIWASTSYGIVHLFIRGDSVYHLENYINQDNVPGETFQNGRVIKTADGTIAMQSLEHVLVFNPSKFQSEKLGSMVLLPKLTRLLVNGQEIRAGDEVDGRVILERCATRTHGFSVDYDQNSIELYFSALNYLRPAQTYYRVRVKGVREYNDWRVLSFGKGNHVVEKNGLLRLSLVGLKPGHYNVELQASLWPETWPQAPYTWTIDVEEPWWRTTGIYVMLGVLLLVLLLANFYLYNRNTRLRLMRNNEEVDILRRVKYFSLRCQGLYNETLSSAYTNTTNQQDPMSREFIDAMLNIVPYIITHGDRSFNMEQLSSVSGIATMKLYGILVPHLDKNPRRLVGLLHLQESTKLLNTTKLPIAEIARQCNFASTNYFIAFFYHWYRMTPADYRKSMPL